MKCTPPPGSGSSPLARGLHVERKSRPVRFRIIPARAGFTLKIWLFSRPRRDHPRSRGVYPVKSDVAGDGPGSSPLARGLPTDPGEGAADTRIIPARAGFTHPYSRSTALLGDHPRSRGVYWSACPLFEEYSGSSPLARGLRVDIDPNGTAARIIPARAGFTEECLRERRRVRDHPRSRGVYGRCVLNAPPLSGSSPLARGLRSRRQESSVVSGIIPARAGFTAMGR